MPEADRPGPRAGRKQSTASWPVKRAVSAGGLVVRVVEGRPEVALIRHRTLKGDTVWGLPKGAVEEGESLEDTASREVQEETGLLTELIEPLDEITYWFTWPPEQVRYKKTVHYFLMRPVGGDLGLHDDEVEEARYFPFPEAVRLARYPSEKRILRTAADRTYRW